MPLYDLLKEDALFGYEHIEKLKKLRHKTFIFHGQKEGQQHRDGNVQKSSIHQAARNHQKV